MPMAMTDAEARARIRLFREPVTLILVALVMIANIVPRNWMFGVRTRETLASEAAWVAGNRVGGFVLLAASVLWVLAAIYLPRRYVKPVGLATLLFSVIILFLSQGWSF